MKELTKTHKSDIFEKLVRARDGRLFRVRFVVVEREGKLRGKVLSCEQIGGLPSFPRRGMKGVVVKGKKGFYLPVLKSRRAVKDKGLKIKDSVASPFSTFDFFVSQMTRAPAYK